MMIKKRSLIRAGAVLGVALAAGHLVQTMNSGRQSGAGAAEAPARLDTGAMKAPADTRTADLAAPDPAAAEPPVVQSVLAGLAGAAVASKADRAPPAEARARPVPAPVPMPVPMPVPVKPAPMDPALVGQVGTPGPAADPVAPVCMDNLGLAATPGARIAVSVSAPCRAGERVVLRHAGLAFAQRLGPDGRLRLDLPALSAAGEVSVLMADGSVLRDAVPVPAAAEFRRFAVQWVADDAFQLHAYENGAAFASPGDVSATNPVSPNGGSLVTLGDPSLDLPMMVEIYSWPVDGSSYAEVVVESAVTELTCGRDLLGETIHANRGSVVVTDLTVSMPGCEAVGDILVLNNLVPETTLAAVN